MGKRSDLTVPQRREVVLMLLRREEPAGKLARRFGVSEQTLHRWRDEFLAGGEAALANGKGGADPRGREVRELKKEVERRDQVIGELTIANRIPEKTGIPGFEWVETNWYNEGFGFSRSAVRRVIVSGFVDAPPSSLPEWIRGRRRRPPIQWPCS